MVNGRHRLNSLRPAFIGSPAVHIRTVPLTRPVGRLPPMPLSNGCPCWMRGLLLHLAVVLSLVVSGMLTPAPTHAAPADRARSIILLIGDGMGSQHRQAARWAAAGLEGRLAMERMPYAGRSHTSAVNGTTTDSAAAATAIATGRKTRNGLVGMDPQGQSLTSIGEIALHLGKSVGLVTTTQVTHATPAAFFTHVPDRRMMNDIARQLLAAGVDVIMGGGEDEWLPPSVTGCYPKPGERSDGRNLIKAATHSGYAAVCDAVALNALDTAGTRRLLGLFADEGMVRPFSPSLAAMTRKAIEILSTNPRGFFLLVEGGQIDWAAHDNDAAAVLGDTVGFDAAVAVAVAHAKIGGDTLVIVTADHETGGLTVTLAATGHSDEDGPFTMPDGRPFWIQWAGTEHTRADVPVAAMGPGARRLAGTYDNTHIFEAMRRAMVGD